MRIILKNARLYVAVGYLVAFVLWTVALCFVDVGAIGPYGSAVGFAKLNGFVRDAVGVNMALYTVTDWLGILPFAVVVGFAFLGLAQLIKRKSFFKVDQSIIALGVFYILVVALYLLFEAIALNYRPVLIDGRLEVSYPSSTTFLTLTVMPTAVMQLRWRLKNKNVLRGFTVPIAVFTLFMTVGRLFSGVHWVTDIVGGVLLGVGLDGLYGWLVCRISK